MARTYLQQQHKQPFIVLQQQILLKVPSMFICVRCVVRCGRKKTKHQQKIARISELTENVYFNTARTGKKESFQSQTYPISNTSIVHQSLGFSYHLGINKKKEKKQTVATFLFSAHHTKSKQSNFKFALGRQGLTPGRPTAKRLPQR